MPSVIGHTIAGVSVGYALSPGNRGALYWPAVIALSIIPDIDVIAFRFGVPYAHPLDHRGFFHSLAFAVAMAIMIAMIISWDEPLKERVRVCGVLSAVAVLHPLLDMLTNGGLGIGIFIPFDMHRYLFPWRPIIASPLGIQSFFGPSGARVIADECAFIALPSLAIIIARLLIDMKRSKP